MKENLLKLNMSGITAFHILSLENATNDQTAKLTVKHKRTNDPAWSHLDWVSGEKWFSIVRTEKVESDLRLFCRFACSIFLDQNPVLTKLAGKGREALVSNLAEDEIQVFRNALLLDDLPDLTVILWWDKYRSEHRKQIDDKKLIQGREAEFLTMQNEISILQESYIEEKPKWVALNGDHYGYDILSYRKDSNGRIHNILIEVKSFSDATNPYIFLTRYEWNKVLESSEIYFFQVWCMEIRQFKIYTFTELKQHIPHDIGMGIWQNIQITLDNWSSLTT